MAQQTSAIICTALSALAFAIAIALGLRLADVRGARLRRAGESRAMLAGAVGVLLLLVATLLWVRYLIFGPIHDLVNHRGRAGD
ncbi:MAG TPA: hypothetical protein VEI24_06895 [Nitrospiria bacterium]|nr:hypothetical protein [Nitrospiria bacterium]